MKFIFSLVALIAVGLLAPLFAQDETPAATPAEETPSATVETSPAATAAEVPSATSSPTMSASPAAAKTGGPAKSASPKAKAAAEAPSGKKMSVDATLKQMEDQWDALMKHDVAAIEPLIAADFVGVNEEGKVQDRRGLLARAKKDKDTYTSSKNERMAVHRYGNNIAVVVGITKDKGTDRSGKKFDRTYRWTDTWMERGGKWECIAEQVTLESRR